MTDKGMGKERKKGRGGKTRGKEAMTRRGKQLIKGLEVDLKGGG